MTLGHRIVAPALSAAVTATAGCRLGGTHRSYRRTIDGDGGWNLWVAHDLLFRMGPSDISFLKGR